MLERQKEIVVEVGKYLFERGFTQLSGGNISVRDPQTNLVAIKPSGVAYGVMKPEDIIIVDINGNVVEGSLSPSIETGMHTGLNGRAKRALNHVSVNIDNNYILGLHNAVSHAARLYRHKICLRISDAYISSGKLCKASFK